MRLSPTTPAVFYDFENGTVSVPLITLMAWEKGIRVLNTIGTDIFGVEQIVRDTLKTPYEYPVEYIHEHLEKVLAETKQHYGIQA